MSSGDPRLDRRYAYARSALEEGATAEAIELLDQTLARLVGALLS